ncbi:hypothetical protein PE067_06290 [Paracoccus sp. DMF-8]|uniref:hypothetical protein n=1 Tax=Paracoccus sp. DMF-8 TaxID=3019445 RepID=UPI0023E75689|nr:hypothetical protein [Paracoccus sp. DMF-8]MDF3605788.1 hypothetical protein [Paracoccus sp. DMF-8]
MRTASGLWGKPGPHRALLIELVEQDPDITMAGLKGALADAEGLHVHESSLSRALRRPGFTFKKNHWSRIDLPRDFSSRCD